MALTTSSSLDIFTNSQQELLQDIGSVMQLLDNPMQPNGNYGLIYEADPYQLQLNNQEIKNPDCKPLNLLEYDSNIVQQVKSNIPSLITTEEYPGIYNFEFCIDNTCGTKQPWLYSDILNKIYIDMEHPFPVDFKWDLNISVEDLYVRATPIYSLSQHAQELVTRCLHHALPTDKSNKNMLPNLLDHVLRCQANNAQYFGNKYENTHLNVRVPLGIPQPGMETVRVMYSFFCKSSCPSGMNRKPFQVIFTLEDKSGYIYGRRKLNARVCSCPKRDKDKEENDRLKIVQGSKQGKKRRMDRPEKVPPLSSSTPLDTTEYTFMVKVCGKEAKQRVLQNVCDVMAGVIVTHGSHPAFEKCLDDSLHNLRNN